MAIDKAMVPYAGEVFNPHEHLMKIPNKNGKTDYLPVQWRLVWFRSLCPLGTIETELVLLDLDKETEEETYVWNNEKRRSEKIIKVAKGIAVFRATVKDGNGGVGTGTKSEKAASFPDYIEKAETGAIGRALAALGYGTQFVGDDYAEGHRIVDSPVEPQPTEQEKEQYQKRRTVIDAEPVQEAKPEAVESSPADLRDQAGATEQQLASIKNLCKLTNTELAGMPESYGAAAKMIKNLSSVLQESRKRQANAK